MNDEIEVLGAVLLIAIFIALFFIGMSIGFDLGQDNIANDWCVSLGYDTGEYDDGAENIVCKYIDPRNRKGA